MWPYFTLLFFVVFFSHLKEKLKANKKAGKVFFFLIAICLILFAGLRNFSVGTDTSEYTGHFTAQNFDYLFLSNKSSIEKGFLLLQYIASKFSHNYYSLLLLIALINTYFQLKIIYKISEIPTISLIVLLSFNIYLFSFNGARQGIALSIYLYAIQYVLEKRGWKYLFWIMIGFFFHRTILIMIPFYFFFQKKFSIGILLLMIIGTFFSVIFFQNLLRLGIMISEKYSVYTEMTATGGLLLTIAHVLLAALFIIFRFFIQKKCRKKYDIFLNMFLIGAIIYIIVQLTSAYIEITRLAIYFLASAVFLWPLTIKCIDKSLRTISFITFIFFNLVYLYFLLEKIGDLIPYKLNTDLFNFY